MRIVLGRNEEKRAKRKRALTEEERYDNGNLDEFLSHHKQMYRITAVL